MCLSQVYDQRILPSLDESRRENCGLDRLPQGTQTLFGSDLIFITVD
jgi:hypothetical protein